MMRVIARVTRRTIRPINPRLPSGRELEVLGHVALDNEEEYGRVNGGPGPR